MKGIIPTIILALLCAHTLQAQATYPTKPVTMRVDDDFNAATPGWQVTRFDKIQDGIDAADPGATVFVYAGTYCENIVVDKTVIVKGEDRESVVIDGTYSGDIVTVKADDVELCRLTVSNTADTAFLLDSDGSTVSDCFITMVGFRGVSVNGYRVDNTIYENTFGKTGTGIYLEDHSGSNHISANLFTDSGSYDIMLDSTSNNTISGNESASPNYYGLYLYLSDENVITGNLFRSHSKGIYLHYSNHNTVSGNEFKDNTYSGLEMGSSDFNIVTGNTAYGNKTAFRLKSSDQNTLSGNLMEDNEGGINLSSSSSQIVTDNTFVDCGIDFWGTSLDHWNTHTMENNTANGKPIYYYKNVTGVTVPSDAASVILANCTSCTLKDLDLSNTDTGILLAQSSQNTITGCRILSNNWAGIGLYLGSTDNLIEGNIIAMNYHSGLWIEGDCNDNAFRENTISDHQWGVFGAAGGCLFEGNTVIQNDEGILINKISGVVLTGNLIGANRAGFDGFGLNLSMSDDCKVMENIFFYNIEGVHITGGAGHEIYHNTFLMNDLNAFDIGMNAWDDGYPSGGNCWDDYAGEDLNGDGLGDTPYAVPGGSNEDGYPLMSPFGGAALCGERSMLSIDSAGSVPFTLFAGAAGAGRDYLLLGSASGTSPGTTLPGGAAVLPLNYDSFTELVLMLLNTPVFSNFMGTLDGQGLAQAQLATPGPMPPSVEGLTLHFAFALKNPWDTVSNPAIVVFHGNNGVREGLGNQRGG